MSDELSDTNKHNIREIELELLSRIHDRIVDIDKRICNMEKRMEVLIQDMNIIHKFQQSFAGRLSDVEKFCIERPLQSVPISKKSSGNGGGM